MTKYRPHCFVRSFCLRVNLAAVLQIVVRTYNTFGYWRSLRGPLWRRRRRLRDGRGRQRPQPLARVNTRMLIGRTCHEQNCHWKRATCKHVPKPFRIASDVRRRSGKRHCCTEEQLTCFRCFFELRASFGRKLARMSCIRGFFNYGGINFISQLT